jgi:uncharacterized protein (TIGR03435 family)
MLQTLLEDRFKLKIRRETREVPVYDLTVAKQGLKLHPVKEGCLFFDPLNPVPSDRLCHSGSTRSRNGGPVVAQFFGSDLDGIALSLSAVLDRPVVNKTGIAGWFDLRLEYGPDWMTPIWSVGGQPPDGSAGPSISAALQEQAGLRLVPAKGPGTFYIIESVERPSDN